MNGAPTFDEFVVAVHGREPFPWQRAMAEMLVSGGPPQLVTVPTGLGKTSVLDAWVWALAIQAEQRSTRTVTTRAAFVVDRRVIVDLLEPKTLAQIGWATSWAGRSRWFA